MGKKEFTYQSGDKKTEIHVICWKPEGEIRAVLQIAHGMVEYIERYEEFAEYLNRRGYLVVGNDHLGHGKSVRGEEWLGYFEEKNGNRIVLQDLHHLRVIMQKQYPDLPYFLLGHSMGSFLVRQYLCLHGKGLAGAVIMGTGYHRPMETCFGMGLSKLMALLLGWEYRSLLIDGMAFGGYNRRYGTLQGKEWLSRNEENVAKYMKDRLCTYRFTINGYYNLFYSIHMLSDEKILKRMPKDLPVLFVSGEQDPVGQYGNGVWKVYKQFIRIGMKDVLCKLYEKDRHEILNEVDREDVYQDIYNWMEYICND